VSTRSEQPSDRISAMVNLLLASVGRRGGHKGEQNAGLDPRADLSCDPRRPYRVCISAGIEGAAGPGQHRDRAEPQQRPVGSWRLRWSFRKLGRSRRDQEARRRGGAVRSVSAVGWTHAAPDLETLRGLRRAPKFRCSSMTTPDLRFRTGTFGRLPSFPDALSPKGTASGPSSSPPKILRAGAFCCRQNPFLGARAPGAGKRPHLETVRGFRCCPEEDHPRKQIETPHSNAARLKKRRAALVQPREGHAKSRLPLVSTSRAKVSCRIPRGADFRAPN